MKLNLILLILLFISCSQENEQIEWPEATQTSKPWTRWWWPGNAVDKENLKNELKQFAEAGIGGVEITPIYGVEGEEERFIEYLSPEFSEILEFTIEEATNLGLGVDLPPGSGWRCGGPFVPREKGLWKLEIKTIDLQKEETLNWPEKEAEIAAASFVSDGGESITIQINSDFKAPSSGKVYFAFRVKSGDKVKRAADGGKGWAIDTFNKEITDWYLDEFWKKLGIDEGKLRCFFHDSFEYTGDFTTDFLVEFKNRRGYDLSNYLHVLAGDSKDEELIARVKSDYRETLSDLVYDSFILPMTEWANQHKSLNRNQAHGSPGNILDLYAACDIPETEIFRYVEPGTVDVFVNKFASSAAHVTGQKLVSSESYTWLKEHWTVTTSDLVRATNRFFLAGINHMFFHGTCYSPENAEWPGWLFYASTQINDRNPLWRELPALFKYIERTQSVLQNATPQNDLLVYWPYYDVAASDGRIFNHIGVNKDAGWFRSHPISELSQRLTDSGFTFDYISDKQLTNCAFNEDGIVTSGDATYKAIVVPKTKYIPLETIKKLKQITDDGGVIIFDEELPKSVPGLFELEKRLLQLEEVKNSMSNFVGDVVSRLEEMAVSGEPNLTEKGFHYLKLKTNDEDIYLLFNTNLDAKDEWVELNSEAKDYIFMNPMTGKISKAAQNGGKIRIQLNSEEIVFVRCSRKSVQANQHIYIDKELKEKQIEGRWKVEFIEGGPVFPGNIDMNELKSWTKAGDMETERFAGTARYSLDLNWDGPTSGFLDLGKVKECARVFLNDKDYGSLLGPEYVVFVDNLQQGKNNLIIEVSNIAANRIRVLDKRGVNWKKFHDINFVNIEYEPFDASDWEIKDAGLMGPVTIKSIK